MKKTPKMFICEIGERIVENGDCCWIQGNIVDIEMSESGELDTISLDDGTSTVKISISDKLKNVRLEGFHEDAIKTYEGIIAELIQKGRFISTVCQLNNGILKVLHVSDSINGSRDLGDE